MKLKIKNIFPILLLLDLIVSGCSAASLPESGADDSNSPAVVSENEDSLLGNMSRDVKEELAALCADNNIKLNIKEDMYIGWYYDVRNILNISFYAKHDDVPDRLLIMRNAAYSIQDWINDHYSVEETPLYEITCWDHYSRSTLPSDGYFVFSNFNCFSYLDIEDEKPARSIEYVDLQVRYGESDYGALSFEGITNLRTGTTVERMVKDFSVLKHFPDLETVEIPILAPKTDEEISEFIEDVKQYCPLDCEIKAVNSHLGDRPAYDDVFKGINSNSSTGAPMSYDEAMEMITSPFQKENGIYLDSFYIVETVRVLPYEEARNLNGWTEICEGKTMYEVKLLKDLISGETVDRTEKIIAATGTVEWQNDGDPVYAPGEKFTVVLTKPQENCDFLQTPVSSMFRYDVVEDATGTTLYSRKSEIDKLNLPATANIDEEIITSTTQNPAVHSQKVGLDTLADFLRSDWEQRGVSAHFEKCEQTAPKTELPRGTEQSAQKTKEETTAPEQTKPAEETSAYVTEYIPLSSLGGAEKPDELPHYTFEEAERLTEEELIGLAQAIRTASSEDFIADYTAVDDMGELFDRSYQISIAPITVETDNDFEEYCRVRANAAMLYTEYENETTEKLGENEYYAEWSNTYTEIRRMFSNDVPVERHIDRTHRSVFLKNFRLDEGSVVYCGEMTAEEIRVNFDLLLSSSLMLARRVTETDEAFFYETVSAHIVGGDWGLNDSIVFGVRRYAIFKGEGAFYAMDRDAKTVFEAEYEIPGTARDLEWE